MSQKAALVLLTVLTTACILYGSYNIKFWMNSFHSNVLPAIKRTGDLKAYQGPEDVSKIQSIRKARLEQYCRTRKHKKVKLKYFLIDDRYQVLYFPVAKAACTTWIAKMMMMHNNYTLENLIKRAHNLTALARNGIYRISHYTPAAKEQIFKKYYKFTFVRHPFSRLVSGYKNKFIYDHDYYYKHFGPGIVKFTRPNRLPSLKDKNITFVEFVDFLMNGRSGLKHDVHFSPAVSACHHCSLNYDFIGKAETSATDTKEIMLKAFNGNMSNIKNPHTTNSTKEKVKKYLADLSPTLFNKLINHYSQDFKAFGYDNKYYFGGQGVSQTTIHPL